MQRISALHSAYQESESPLVTPMRAVTSTVGSWFEENEVAQVTRMMRSLDPYFSREAFERELREYIVPEVVDAYLSADREALTRWCSEAVSTLSILNIWVAELLLRADIQCAVGNNGAVPSSGAHQ